MINKIGVLRKIKNVGNARPMCILKDAAIPNVERRVVSGRVRGINHSRHRSKRLQDLMIVRALAVDHGELPLSVCH